MNLNQPIRVLEKTSEGLKSYLAKVYNYMAGGLLLSGVVAYVTTKEPFVSLFYTLSPEVGISYSVWGWIAILSPLILIFMISAQLSKLNVAAAQGLFWLFSALMGVSLSNIFLLYSNESIVQTFLVCAGSFWGLSLYANNTSRDLSGMGRFLIQGLIGLIIVMVVNLFMKSSGLNLLLSVVGIGIFAGLTAYDTQKLKMIYAESDGEDVKEAKAISGALSLYLDFINLFRMLLVFLGDRRD